MKRPLTSLVVLLLVLSIGLTACTSQPSATPAPTTKPQSAEYSVVYSGEVTTMNYLVTSTEIEFAVAANTVDGLVEHNNYGVIQGALAKEWKHNDDYTVWTFKIREGVKWYTWDGKEYGEVTAQDWLDAAKYILTKTNASKTANMIYNNVVGAADYYNGKTTDFSKVGIKAVDKYTLEYTVNRPIAYFLTYLTFNPYLPASGKFLAEVGDRFGTTHQTLLANGAYILKDFQPQVQRVYAKNENYWDRANVFIPKLVYKYNKEASTLGPELFARGEISSASIPIATAEQWLKDPVKKNLIRPATTSFYTYFYAFNFEPKFDKKHEPDNWAKAVNNANFRKSIFHALDRKVAMITAETYKPERRISNTLNPNNLLTVGGTDYTQIGELAKFANTDSFDKVKAIEYRDKAKQELAGRATFPIKVLMPYNTGSTDWTNRVQVVEQQLENLLGKDYIDIIAEGYPPTGFLDATRRSGNYALQECNAGPTYADPLCLLEPFLPPAASVYNKPFLATEYIEANGKSKLVNLVDAANAEVIDMKKRYELFAKAEAFMIGEALLIPYGIGGGGYVGSRINPFTAPYAPFGISYLKFKWQKVEEKPMTTEQFEAAQLTWQKERAEALKKAGQ